MKWKISLIGWQTTENEIFIDCLFSNIKDKMIVNLYNVFNGLFNKNWKFGFKNLIFWKMKYLGNTWLIFEDRKKLRIFLLVFTV